MNVLCATHTLPPEWFLVFKVNTPPGPMITWSMSLPFSPTGTACRMHQPSGSLSRLRATSSSPSAPARHDRADLRATNLRQSPCPLALCLIPNLTGARRLTGFVRREIDPRFPRLAARLATRIVQFTHRVPPLIDPCVQPHCDVACQSCFRGGR